MDVFKLIIGNAVLFFLTLYVGESYGYGVAKFFGIVIGIPIYIWIFWDWIDEKILGN